MKLSELISKLQALEKDHADKEVRFATMSGEWIVTQAQLIGEKEPGVFTGSMFSQYPDEPARIVLTGRSLG